PPRSSPSPYTTLFRSVIAYDYAGNAAPDGTAINFVAESGFIEPASCTTVGGTCSVNWQSGGLRPGVSTLSSDLLRSNEVEAVGGDRKSTRLNSSHVKS